MEDLLWNLPNIVSLADWQWHTVSLILMVSYGAHFAFILYFLATSQQLAPRYKLVAILSAVVMASAGLSLFREWSMWNETYSFVNGVWVPLAEGQSFSNVYRYGNWLITVPILLTQLPLAFALPRKVIHSRALRMGIPALLMIITGLVGQFGEVSDLGMLNLWGIISTLFFFWLIFEVYLTLKAGMAASPGNLAKWPWNLLFFFLFTWGLYPIAYALPQLGADGNVVIAQQLVFSIADISSKLIYGVILSRYCLRRSALEGYPEAVSAMAGTPYVAAEVDRV